MSCLKARFFNLFLLSDVLLCSIEDQRWFPFSRRLTPQKDLCFILRNGYEFQKQLLATDGALSFTKDSYGTFCPAVGNSSCLKSCGSCERIIVWISDVFFQAGVQGFTLASCAAKSCSQNLKKLGDFPETLTPTWPYLQRISKDNHGPAIKWLQLGGKKKRCVGANVVGRWVCNAMISIW